MRSRRKSAWPQWRAYSSIMWSRTSRRTSAPGQLLGVEPGALQLQGEPVVAQVAEKQPSLTVEAAVLPWIVLRGGPHVPPPELPRREVVLLHLGRTVWNRGLGHDCTLDDGRCEGNTISRGKAGWVLSS
jgi:hypothetical protein